MAVVHGVKVKLFTLNSNPELAREIADYMDIGLSECSLTRFSDGEVSINIPETVRGHHTFVVQSTSNPVNEHYMELLIMIDALKRASARTINVIMPYYGYSRQDRKSFTAAPHIGETDSGFINCRRRYESDFHGFACRTNSGVFQYPDR